MTAQIPSDWHPDSYVVDESNKVVWKLGSFPADRQLWDTAGGLDQRQVVLPDEPH